MRYFFYNLIFCFSFSSITILAQNKFEPGYVINAQKDTLTGFIEYEEWSQNPVEVSFKSNIESKAQSYLPKDILSFYVHDKKYVKAAVLADETGRDIKVSPEFPFHPVLEDTVLLLELVPGVKSLYYLKDKKDKEHFYINRNGQMEWLIFQFYKNEKNIPGVDASYVTNQTYKAQVYEYLKNCSSINRRVNILSYSKKSLTKIFWSFYENCADLRR